MKAANGILPKDYLIDEKYKVVMFIKSGVNAENYRVKGSDGKLYFLKFFDFSKLHKTAFDEDGNILEIKILKNAHHPNVVSFKDHGEIFFQNQRYSYLVLHFIAVETLADRISRDSVSTWYYIKFYVSSILNGLKYLHTLQEPIIHNEVTLSNVMLDLSSTIPIPKLIDFGYSRPFYRSTKVFNREGINPYYLASECYNNIYSP